MPAAPKVLLDPVAQARTLKMILDRLFTVLRQRLGPLPDTYLCVDLETSGINSKEDFILQIGHCLVKQGQIIDQQAFCLNWLLAKGRSKGPGVLDDKKLYWLQERTATTCYHIRKNGSLCHMTWPRLLKEGVEPLELLAGYSNWFQEIKEAKQFLITHNGYRFDCKFLDRHFLDYLGLDREHFGADNIIDTGVILKAAQLGLVPHEGESMRLFAQRVGNKVAKGVQWSLSDYAVPYFGLDQEHQLDLTQAHDAGYDSYLCHLLFAKLKELSLPAAVTV